MQKPFKYAARQNQTAVFGDFSYRGMNYPPLFSSFFFLQPHHTFFYFLALPCAFFKRKKGGKGGVDEFHFSGYSFKLTVVATRRRYALYVLWIKFENWGYFFFSFLFSFFVDAVLHFDDDNSLNPAVLSELSNGIVEYRSLTYQQSRGTNVIPVHCIRDLLCWVCILID